MIIYPDPSLVTYANTVVSIEDLILGAQLDGVDWIFDQLDGWHLGGAVAASFDGRPNQHGSFDGPVYRRARVITIGGTCVADDPAVAEDAAEALAACLADGRLGSFTVHGARRSLSCDVRLSDTPQSAWFDESSFSWSLQFTAPDPRKYGPESVVNTRLPGADTTGLQFPISGGVFDFGQPTSRGQITIVNTGTAPTEPVFDIDGPLASGFEVTHLETGRRLRYEALVGGRLTLNASTGRASLGGQDRSGNLTIREWPVIGPKETATFAFTSLGSETDTSDALMTATASPAYF